MHKRIELITPALDIIKSDYYGVFRSMTVDHRLTILDGIDVARDIFNKCHTPTTLNNGRHFPNLGKAI